MSGILFMESSVVNYPNGKQMNRLNPISNILDLKPNKLVTGLWTLHVHSYFVTTITVYCLETKNLAQYRVSFPTLFCNTIIKQ